VAGRRRVLILGGTTEASVLARALAERSDLEVTTSYAGRTSSPTAPAGRTRVGGFGGVRGLARYLRTEGVDVLVDATHPFAARMRWHAFEAAGTVGTPCVRVERPGWQAGPGDRWVRVADLDAAARALVEGGHRRVLLTTGRTELAPFVLCAGVWFLVRSIEPPDPQPLPDASVVLARGPFTVEGERALMTSHRIDAVVTKDSGGSSVAAKLVAARELGLPVIVVDRPPSPPGPLVRSVAEAQDWLDAALGRLGPLGR
jgi:precorrin-6A/cobalt-precorrin-6A reductase